MLAVLNDVARQVTQYKFFRQDESSAIGAFFIEDTEWNLCCFVFFYLIRPFSKTEFSFEPWIFVLANLVAFVHGRTEDD